MTKHPNGFGQPPDPKRISVPKFRLPKPDGKSAEIIDFPSGKQAPPLDVSHSIPPIALKEGGEGGEGGPAATFAPVAPTNRQFLETIFSDLPAGAVALVTAKPGDPTTGPWTAHKGEGVERICTPDKNTYVNCASCIPLGDGTVAATKAQTAAYHFLLLDDVGTKVDLGRIDALKPTWMIETSPGNYQVGYRLREPLRDENEVNRLIDRIADAGLTDKGAKGMNRWARLPHGINGKLKYVQAGVSFACKLFQWNAEVSYTSDELLGALAPDSGSTSSRKGDGQVVKNPSLNAPDDDGAVYVPKPPTNAVVSALKAQNLYKGRLGDGKHDITCPWVPEHTDAIDTGACYFEPSAAYPFGGFKCQHSHGDEYHIGKLTDHLGLETQVARNRPLIRSTPGELHTVVRAAEHVLSQQPNYYQAGGAIVRVRYDFTGEPSLEIINDSALTLALAEFCDWKKYDGRKSAWVICDPPPGAVRHLLQAKPYQHLQEIEGFAHQPYYRRDGQLVFTPGYDAPSRRLAVFDASNYQMPEATRDAAIGALATLDELLGEFHYATEIDRAAALSAVLTAIIRPSLETAPAYHVAAPSPGSGKSLLCNVIARLASPSEPLRLPYPKEAQEADKVIFASLLPQPATIMFDDMIDDWKPHGIINSALTAATITGRILGVSKTAMVSTRVLFLGSGNNVGPIRDLSRRVITISLNARSESPATLTYRGDPMAALKANRDRYVVAGLTIIEAFRAAGSPKTDVVPIASYNGDWANHCRHPLIWLSLPDPASILIEQVKADPEDQPLRFLLDAWHRKFGERPTKVSDLLNSSLGADDELDEAIHELPIAYNGNVDPGRLGLYLKKHKDRPIGEYLLEAGPKGKRRTWCVRRPTAPAKAPPSPLLPPSHEPSDEIDGRAPEDAF